MAQCPAHGEQVGSEQRGLRKMTTAYDAEPWHDLFVAVAGAAAALAGLVFVAVSLNHEEILETPRLPSLAARSIATLIAVLAMACLILTPGQSPGVLGVEVLVLGAVFATAMSTAVVRAFDARDQMVWRLEFAAIAVVSSVPMVVAGSSLIVHSGGGLYWAMAESLTGVVAAVYYGWILLIEIRR